MKSGGKFKTMLCEGVFRRPRLWSNSELKKIAHLFEGWVVNVSAWKDLDKSATTHLKKT